MSRRPEADHAKPFSWWRGFPSRSIRYSRSVDIALCTRQTASHGSKQVVGEIVRSAFLVARMKREASLGARVSTITARPHEERLALVMNRSFDHDLPLLKHQSPEALRAFTDCHSSAVALVIAHLSDIVGGIDRILERD